MACVPPDHFQSCFYNSMETQKTYFVSLYIHSGTVIRQRGMEELCRGLISDTQSQKRQNRTELCSYRLLSKKEQKIGSLFPSHQQASKIWLHQWGQGPEVLEKENDCMTDLILSPDLQQSKLKVKAGLNPDGFHFFPKTYQLSEFMRTGKCCGIVSYSVCSAVSGLLQLLQSFCKNNYVETVSCLFRVIDTAFSQSVCFSYGLFSWIMYINVGFLS